MTCVLAAARLSAVSESTVPSDAAIRQILIDRIDVQHQSVGIVVGLIAHMLKHRRQKLHQEIEQLIAFERGNLS